VSEPFEIFKPEDCTTASMDGVSWITIPEANRIVNKLGKVIRSQGAEECGSTQYWGWDEKVDDKLEALVLGSRPIKPEKPACDHKNGHIVVYGQVFDIDHDFCPRCGEDLR